MPAWLNILLFTRSYTLLNTGDVQAPDANGAVYMGFLLDCIGSFSDSWFYYVLVFEV